MQFAKSCFIWCLIFLISGVAIAADPAAKHPKTGKPLVIDCFRGTPKIDGNLKDWDLGALTPAVLDTKEQIFPGAAQGAKAWTGPKDSSGEFYVQWDDNNVYIAAVMKDDKLSNQKTGGAIWNADTIEVFFSTPNAVAPHAEHYQYGFDVKDQIWNWCNMDGAGNRKPDYMDTRSAKTSDGYICEVAINYSHIKSLGFKAGNTIGFHPCFDDADDGPDRQLQMTWTGREAHDQSNGFGHIILSNRAVAPVDAKDKLATAWSEIKTQQ